MKAIAHPSILISAVFAVSCGGATPQRSAGYTPAPEGDAPGERVRTVVSTDMGDARYAEAPAEAVAEEPPPERSEGPRTAARDERPMARPSSVVARGGARVSKTGAAGTAIAAPSPDAYVVRSGVKAGEWDDNANYLEFQKYLAASRAPALDVRNRRFVVVRDARGKAVPGCTLRIQDDAQNSASLRTTSSGRAILFPRSLGLVGERVSVSTHCAGGRDWKSISLREPDGVVTLDLQTTRTLRQRPVMEIAIVLDTTGSMSEEIAAVKQTIHDVASVARGLDADLRIALVEFKDRTDAFVTRVYPFTSDIPRFAHVVSGLSAQGGGDTPESVNAGLHAALTELNWRDDSVIRLAFLIGDAPPHLDYQQDVSYTQSARLAASHGIQVHTIAASGMDRLGQSVWRQIAQYTGATNMFVLRGGAGPQSTGAGDPESSCGGTHQNYASGNLHALILRKIEVAVRALHADPMRIPGLGGDERAKPCEQRILAVD